MILTSTNSGATALREFNPCHDGKTGQFAGKGTGDCQPVTPDKVYEKQRTYALEMQKLTNAEVAFMVGPDGKQIPYPNPAKGAYKIANWLHENEPDESRSAVRQTLKKDGYALGVETSVMVPEEWREADGSTFVHTHPSGTTFSPGDMGYFGISKAEAAVVFGPEGEWYEARKTPDSDLSERASVDLYDEMQLERARWMVDATVELFRQKGYTVKRRAMPDSVAYGDDVHYSVSARGKYYDLLPSTVRNILINDLFHGDMKTALKAATKAVDHRPRFDKVMTNWAKKHKVFYRSWLHVKPSA